MNLSTESNCDTMTVIANRKEKKLKGNNTSEHINYNNSICFFISWLLQDKLNVKLQQGIY